MKFLGFAYLAILLGVSSAQEINYYSDSDCTQYAGQVDVTWASQLDVVGRNCYDYNYGQSVNIADCSETFCICYFYPEINCQGTNTTLVGNQANNCLTDSANYGSFGCYYSN